MAFSLLKPTRHDVYSFIDPTTTLSGAAAGKTVLITGAGGGIGRGIAESFALAGATELILVGRRKQPLQASEEAIKTVASKCRVTIVDDLDIADQGAVDNLFRNFAVVPDFLVNNAAVSASVKPVADSKPSEWWCNMEINLRGTYLMTRAYLAALKRTNKTSARIANVSSNSSWAYLSGLSSYAASKVALNTFTEYVDKESIENGTPDIRCVAMHPGGVPGTDLSNGMDLPENIRARMIDAPALAGGTAVYLATKRAEYLMGRFVSATWDMEELEKLRERVVKEDLLRTRVVGV